MFGVGTHIAVLLGGSKSSRQCNLSYLLTTHYRSYEKLNIAEARLLPLVRWLPKQGAEVERLTLDTGGEPQRIGTPTPTLTLTLTLTLTTLTLTQTTLTRTQTRQAQQPLTGRNQEGAPKLASYTPPHCPMLPSYHPPPALPHAP